MQRNVEPSAIFFQAFTSTIRSFTGSSCQCLETPAALNSSLMLTFTELTWSLWIRSKATWAKSFLMLLAYRKQIIQNQRKTVRRRATISVCWRKNSCELFPLATTHAKVANSGKMVIARYRICNFFKKERRSRYRSWKISSLLPSSEYGSQGCGA